MDFSSDDNVGCCAEVAHLLADSSLNDGRSHQDEVWMGHAQRLMREIFEKPDLVVCPVVTEAAATALALSALCPTSGRVICHTDSYLATDVYGSLTFLGGGTRPVPVDGQAGHISPEAIEWAACQATNSAHHSCIEAVSLSQATEFGTVYTPDALYDVSETARRLGLAVHMDGRRFANAVVATGFSPAEMTWCAGIDVLSFGTTRNGTWAADAVVFFDPERAYLFDRLMHRVGHGLSKPRFIAAQLVAILDDGIWLRNAHTANTQATRLAMGVRSLPHVEVLFPVETNVVFLHVPSPVLDSLESHGVHYTLRPDLGPECLQLTCSFATTGAEVDAIVDLMHQCVQPAVPC
jgi:threonine aldolase